jgi:hypothetical protein
LQRRLTAGFRSVFRSAASGQCSRQLKALIVRANIEIHNAPIHKDRVDFTGALEQIAEDIRTTQKLGAAEIVFDVQFSPGVETAGDIAARMEQLWRVAKQA